MDAPFALVTTIVVLLIALGACLLYIMHLRHEHRTYKEERLRIINGQRDVIRTLRDHIATIRDEMDDRDQQIITLSKKLSVAMKINSRDNEYSAPAPFPETQPMPLEGLITTYQKQKQ